LLSKFGKQVFYFLESGVRVLFGLFHLCRTQIGVKASAISMNVEQPEITCKVSAFVVSMGGFDDKFVEPKRMLILYFLEFHQA
jgi:hypothetical protein